MLTNARGSVIIDPIEGGGRLGEQGLVLAKALIDVPVEVVPIRVLNTSKDKRLLRAGTTTTTVTPVELESSPINKGKHGACTDVLPNLCAPCAINKGLNVKWRT